MSTERCSRGRERLLIRMEISLRRAKRTVSGNLPQHVHRNAGVGHLPNARAAVAAAKIITSPQPA
jgi:hypothetical protein